MSEVITYDKSSLDFGFFSHPFFHLYSTDISLLKDSLINDTLFSRAKVWPFMPCSIVEVPQLTKKISNGNSIFFIRIEVVLAAKVQQKNDICKFLGQKSDEKVPFSGFYVSQHATFQKSFQTLGQKICSCTQKVVTLQSVMRDDVHAESTLSFQIITCFYKKVHVFVKK